MVSRSEPIKVLAKATELIEVLAAEGPLSPAEAAERMGIPRSSAYRLVDGLTAAALVELLHDGRVRLSTRWLSLADIARDSMTEWSDATSVLERLVALTGQTAFLSVLSDGAAVCIDWRQGRGIDLLATKPGRSLPLNAGASGRVMLAYSRDSEALLESGSAVRMTSTSLMTVAELREDIATTLRQGYAFSDGDVAAGIAGIAMPVMDDDGDLAGTVAIAGLADVFRDDTATLAATLAEELAVLQGLHRL